MSFLSCANTGFEFAHRSARILQFCYFLLSLGDEFLSCCRITVKQIFRNPDLFRLQAVRKGHPNHWKPLDCGNPDSVSSSWVFGCDDS